MKEIKNLEDENIKIFEIFAKFLINKNTQEANYILNNLIKNNLVKSTILQNKIKPYFIHYVSNEEIDEFIKNSKYQRFIDQITENYEELSKNDWELHKKYVEEGVNPNEIAKIIRNDEIEKLQEISSLNDFDFNQKIKPSIYERYSFINKEDISLINFAAFFGSIKCFKYLLMNNANINDTGKYAIAGGNLEIIHLCEQNHSTFEKVYKTAIKFHRNDVFKYIYENKIKNIKKLKKLGKECVLYHNYEILLFLQEEGMKIKDPIINESARTGNIFLIKHFLKTKKLSDSILIFSAESGNVELVEHIIQQKELM